MTDHDLRRLRSQVDDIADRYDEGQYHGPGLLAQIESPDAHLTVERRIREDRRPRPGSRPVCRIDLLDLAQTIRRGAHAYAQALGAAHVRDSLDALRRLPALAASRPAGEPLRGDVCRRVDRWHHTCRVALAYADTVVTYPGLTCPYCGQESLRVRPDYARVWCVTTWCVDPDGAAPTWNVGKDLWMYVR